MTQKEDNAMNENTSIESIQGKLATALHAFASQFDYEGYESRHIEIILREKCQDLDLSSLYNMHKLLCIIKDEM